MRPKIRFADRLARSFGLLAPCWLSALVMLALGVLLLPIVNNRAMIQAREAAQQRAETLANHTSSV